MSSIQEILASILQAVYGKDVRQAIHDGVEMAYNKADNAETSAAAAADAASGSQNSAAASAQAAANSASSASDFADAAEQYKNEAFHTTPAGYEAFVSNTNSSLDYLAETGVKNLWDISNMENVRSSGGLTYTKNADGSVSISAGTAQGSSTYFHTFYSSDGIIKPNVTYDVSLGITIGGANNPVIQISVKDTSSSSWRSIKTISGGVQSGTFTAPNSFYALDVQLIYTTGDTISEATTIYPMIKYHGIQDNSFVPYAQSNAALTERTKWKLLMNGNNEHFDLSANSSIDISTLDWEEINVAVQVSTTQWVIIPFNKAFGAGSLLGGYYYSSQYNASICLKLENNIISLNSGWTALTPAFGNSANGEYNAWVYYR